VINILAPIRPGQLRDRVTIQVNAGAGTRDSRGQETETWTTFVTGWADVEPIWLGAKEATAAQQTQADQAYLVLMRYRAGVKPKMRLLFGSHTLDIQAAMDPDGRHHKLVLRCVERRSTGTA
jgi:SPP1 family predicted phage head-tail adaptor